jgi:sugar fermentation stimulation protein A
MEFDAPLVEGRLIKRHSRFLADVELASGEFITAHTSNTGAMLGCKQPGSKVWLSESSNPKRKYRYTWEIVEAITGAGVVPVGINTMRSNLLVKEAIENGTISELQGYNEIRTEVKYGKENSRIDLLLRSTGTEKRNHTPCYVEVKNVTLVENKIASFPDAVSKRGAKHLRELMNVVSDGGRAVIFYCIQRADVIEFRSADHIDLAYGQFLRQSVAKGVEPLAYLACVTSKSIHLTKSVPVVVPA